MIKLAKIFYKISGIEIDLIKALPEYEDAIWYFSDKDRTPNKKATVWAISRLDSGEPDSVVEEAFNFILSGKIDSYSQYTAKEVIDIINKNEFSSNEPGKNRKYDDYDDYELSADFVYNALSDYFKKNNIKFIQRGEDSTSTLGHGQYGTVFDVLYKNINCAMKVTIEENEYDIYKKVKEKYSELDSELQKHLPKIYVTDAVKNNKGDTFYVIIMEKLEPFTSELNYSSYTNTQKEYKYKKREMLDKYIIPKLYKILNKNYKDKSKGIIYDLLNDSSYKKLYNDHRMISDIDYILENVLLRNGLTDEGSLEIISEIAQEVDIVSSNYVNPIPRGSRDIYNKYYEFNEIVPDKKVEEFNNAMWRLVDEGIFKPEDLHENNLMMRKSDGAIVVADLGLFGDFEE